MATAEELMATLSDSIPEHVHNVFDSDTYFVIDPSTRQITNTATGKNTLMQYDHNSERFTFELPRYVEGHDMTKCNAVKVHFNNIDSETEVENEDVYDVDDLRIDPTNPDNVLCSWLISRNATQLVGILSFLVQYTCVDDNGNVVYEWHSDIYYDIEIKSGRNNTEAAILEYTDVLEAWRERLFGAGDSAVNEINSTFETKKSALLTESQTQQANIAAKGAEILGTIPEDYAETYNMADEALRRKADAIILSETNHDIILDDSSDNNLIGLKLYGKTTQVVTTGNQLLPITSIGTNVDRNLRRTVINGECFIRGTAYSDGPFKVTLLGEYNSTNKLFSLSPGTYYVSDCYICTFDGTNRVGYMNESFTTDTEFNVTWVATRTYNPGEYVYERTYPMVNVGSAKKTWERFSNFTPSPTPSNPQPLESITNPSVRICGKNLLDVFATELTSNETLDVSPDGYTVTVTGGGDKAYTSSIIRLDASVFSGRTLIFKADEITATNADALSEVQFNMETPDRWIYSGISSKTLSIRNEIPVDAKQITIGFYTNNSNAALGTDNMMTVKGLCLYLEDTDWLEPASHQSLTLTRKLNGIPVPSDQNGNYTDENGQKWVRDEIDFERGKFIQRIAYYEFDGSSDESWNSNPEAYGGAYLIQCADGSRQYDTPLLCNYYQRVSWGAASANTHFCFLNGYHSFAIGGKEFVSICSDLNEFKAKLAETPLEVAYVLGTPVEHDLDPAELEAFRALTTNATDTVILNNKSARMSVKYIADLERYIYKNVSYKKQRFDLNLQESLWVASSDGRYYTQDIDIDVRPNSEINLCPTAAQQVRLILDGIAMFIANDNGKVTAYCIGSTPGKDMTIPATETVVVFA